MTDHEDELAQLAKRVEVLEKRLAEVPLPAESKPGDRRLDRWRLLEHPPLGIIILGLAIMAVNWVMRGLGLH